MSLSFYNMTKGIIKAELVISRYANKVEHDNNNEKMKEERNGE